MGCKSNLKCVKNLSYGTFLVETNILNEPGVIFTVVAGIGTGVFF